MGKTREQLLNEKKIEIEISQTPSRLGIDKLQILKDVLQTTKPMNVNYGEDQKWESVWNDDEIEVIKHKVLSIIRDI